MVGPPWLAITMATASATTMTATPADHSTRRRIRPVNLMAAQSGRPGSPLARHNLGVGSKAARAAIPSQRRAGSDPASRRRALCMGPGVALSPLAPHRHIGGTILLEAQCDTACVGAPCWSGPPRWPDWPPPAEDPPPRRRRTPTRAATRSPRTPSAWPATASCCPVPRPTRRAGRTGGRPAVGPTERPAFRRYGQRWRLRRVRRVRQPATGRGRPGHLGQGDAGLRVGAAERRPGGGGGGQQLGPGRLPQLPDRARRHRPQRRSSRWGRRRRGCRRIRGAEHGRPQGGRGAHRLRAAAPDRAARAPTPDPEPAELTPPRRTGYSSMGGHG